MSDQTVNKIPRHIAIIMDGNRRWARERGLPVVAGHKKVVDEIIEDLIEAAAEAGVEYITFWAWSSENWKRPPEEVGSIMDLFRWGLRRKARRFIERGARLRVIGNWRELETDIVADIDKTLEQSKTNDRINVTFAVNYGGRDEIVRAVGRLFETEVLRLPDLSPQLRAVQDDKLNFESLLSLSKGELKLLFGNHLDTAKLPDPDMIVRTGGEQRLSGFLLWQAEYSELFFPDWKMPEFSKRRFNQVLDEYAKRQRRFGS